MASAGHSVVNVELHDNRVTCLASVRDVFSTSALPLAVSLTSLGRSRAVRSTVSGDTFGSCIFAVVLASQAESVSPFKWRERSLRIEGVNGFLPGGRSFISAEAARYTGSPDSYSIEVALLLL